MWGTCFMLPKTPTARGLMSQIVSPHRIPTRARTTRLLTLLHERHEGCDLSNIGGLRPWLVAESKYNAGVFKPLQSSLG